MALTGKGYLKRVTDKIRLYIDDSGTSAKFSDAQLLDMIRRHWADVISDLNRVSAFKVRARIDIAVVADQRDYALPPTVGKFLSFEKLDANGYVEWEVEPNHPLSPSGPGFTIEGPLLRLDPVWKENHTMRMTYVPNAEAGSFEASATAGSTTSAVTAENVLDGGLRDTRPSSYLGYVLRILDANGNSREERLITGDTGTVFTPSPAFTVNPASQKIEVIPNHAFRLEDIVALSVAEFCARITGDNGRGDGLNLERTKAMRGLRLDLSQGEQRNGRKMQRVIRGNRRWGKTGR